ncbi:4'-phosphopantetheinyl transferase family protein [Aminipila luticellarii]|uniref:4'-phosphopantetheinyl transferase superfamily protein n=1 Tax=Aminipila luticellarii TaxID=2507160 RepID=A0A410PUG9_9FIRM|nr:4'-phosphopantetheinyl transferase superfamily protein [Aminipila luticellarii]QAT42597.1 4'-phosphopantetheinyl transferase superfamily protein [Aminipila luticellarii]
MILYVYNGKEHKGKNGEELIKRALKDYSGDVYKDAVIRRGKQGKPYFENVPVNFSVSHSGSLWVCLVAVFPVGVDIQLCKELPYEKLAKRFFTEEEAAYVQQKGAEAFFQVWTRKEAYVKYTGLGFSGQGFSTFSVVERRKDGSGEWRLASRIGNDFVKAIEVEQVQSTEGFSLLPGEKILGAVCGQQLEGVQIKKW